MVFDRGHGSHAEPKGWRVGSIETHGRTTGAARKTRESYAQTMQEAVQEAFLAVSPEREARTAATAKGATGRQANGL